MKTTAALLAAALAVPAAAHDLSNLPTPTAEFSYRFGGSARPDRLELRLAAAHYVRIEGERQALPLAAVHLVSGREPYSSFLGMPVAAKSAASPLEGEAAESSSGSNPWLWIGVGAVAVAGVAALGSSMSSDNSVNVNGNGERAAGNQTRCGVSGDVIGPTSPTVDPDCR